MPVEYVKRENFNLTAEIRFYEHAPDISFPSIERPTGPNFSALCALLESVIT